METRIKNYVRTYRKCSGLSQRDLAFLLGLQSSQMVSRYEKNGRLPSLKIIIAASMIFNTPPGVLFPSLTREVEKLLITRAISLAKKHKDNKTPIFLHKLGFLLEVIARLEERDKS